MPETLIDYYKAIEESSQRMPQAAKIENWDEVVRHEGVCSVLIEQLRHCAKTQKLAPNHRHQKGQIMQRILRNDAQIRLLAEPWPAKFDQMMDKAPQTVH